MDPSELKFGGSKLDADYPKNRVKIARRNTIKPRLEHFPEAPELMQAQLTLNKAAEESGRQTDHR